MREASYNKVFFSNKDDDDRWYKAKLIFITFDEKSDKERHSNFTYLVQAKSMQRALNNIDEVMNNSMIDYDVVGLSETKICDVFEHKVQTSKKKEE